MKKGNIFLSIYVAAMITESFSLVQVFYFI